MEFDIAFGLRKNSPFKNLVDTFMLDIREKGIVDELWTKYENQKVTKSCLTVHSMSFDINSLSGVFWTVGIGTLVSAVFLIAECIYTAVIDKELHEKGVLGSMKIVIRSMFPSIFRKGSDESYVERNRNAGNND